MRTLKIGSLEFKFGKSDEVVPAPKSNYNDNSGVVYGQSYPIINKSWDGGKDTRFVRSSC